MADDVVLDDSSFGTCIGAHEGPTLGPVRGSDEHGFRVSFAERRDVLAPGYVAPGGALGEADPTWRCWGCGAMGGLWGGGGDRGAPVEDSYCRAGG